jgi:hypothetical protein
MSIRGYYNRKYWDFQQEIGQLSEEDLIQKSTADLVKSYLNKISLPQVGRDEKKQITIKEITQVSVVDDDGDLSLRRGKFLRIYYPIQDFDRIEEVLNRMSDVEHPRGWTDKYGRNCLELDVGVMENSQEMVDSEEREKRVADSIKEVEENFDRRNRLVKGLNLGIEAWMTEYVDNLKKALIADREERKERESNRTKKRNSHDDDGNWDDDSEKRRTPNDDRSDTLNPNNPAYDAARDNRSNQLNPNNPRYHGK